MSLTLADVDLTNLDTFVAGVPHDQFDVIRREAPVYFHPETDGGAGFWCITRFDHLYTISHEWPTFSSEWGITLHEEMTEEQLEQQRMMMLMMDPPNHTKLRRIVNKGFTPRMIGGLKDKVRAITSEIVDDIAERGECDFVVDVAAELPLQVIAEMMGVPQEDRHKVFEWSNRMIGSEDPEYQVSQDDYMNAAMEMFTYANDLAAKKRAEPGDDIISVLLQSEVEGERLSDIEFDLFFQLLAVAGNETTRNLISHGMLALIENPDQRALLVEDPEKMPMAVDEMLRWASPVMYMRRTAREPFEIDGQTIDTGQKVALWYIAANHDPEVFDDPHRFDITRQPNEHEAFGGGGPHFCLGSHLARLEIRAMFDEIIARVPDMELAGPVERLRSNFINGIKHMPVRFAATSRAGCVTGDLPGLDWPAVERFLLGNVDGLVAPLVASLIAAGGSNLTFRVDDAADRSVALRRPPVAAVLATAHDMDREWRILSALTDTTVPVPAPLARCDDADVTGAPFYVMTFADGTILRTEADGARMDRDAADTATDSLVDVQVAMHALDVEEIGLGDLARNHTGYVERQLRRWKTQVERAQVRDLPLMDEIHDRLAASVPEESGRPALVHGDYRFDNVVLGGDHRVAAVLDWELATIGDAVADVCWSLLYWADPGDPLPFLTSAPTLADVFERRSAVASRYATRSGRDLDVLGWFTVFGYWKMACIVEGVYARRLKGASGGGGQGDPSTIAARVDALLDVARDTASELGWGTL